MPGSMLKHWPRKPCNVCSPHRLFTASPFVKRRIGRYFIDQSDAGFLRTRQSDERIVETQKTVEQAVVDLQEAVKKQNVGILHIPNLQETLRKKGGCPNNANAADAKSRAAALAAFVY